MPSPKALGEYDVVVEGAAASPVPDAEAAAKIAGCLFTKGYCVCDLKVKEDVISDALREALQLQESARFGPPPRELSEALLGEEGSSHLCELAAEGEEGPGITDADEQLSRVARLLMPLGEDLGIRIESRSHGLLHSVGFRDDDEEAPALTEFECQKWLQQLVKAPLMALLFLGPAGGTLELQPFRHEEVPPVEVQVQPGTMVVLRCDSLSHKYTSSGRSVTLSCWLNQETILGDRSETLVSTPVTQELFNWATDKIREFKQRQEVGEEGAEFDPAFPKEWQKAANRMFHMGQQVSLQGVACKFPGTYSPEGYWRSQCFGVDMGVQVPFLRWNHEESYDPNPESWKYMKSYCRHATFFEGSDLFDNRFFGISVMESRQMDPMQRHILETSYEALFQSGYNKKRLMRSLVGVYVGGATSEFNYMPITDSSAGTGGANSITSNRISFCLGLQGPSFTIDCQGASALTAIGNAATSCKVQTDKFKPNHTAMAGGVFLMVVPNTWVLACAASLLSPQGRCLSFDVSAEGFIKGEGVSNVVMKPKAALVDGKQVDDGAFSDSFISATNQGHTGAGASLYAPHGPMERELILQCVRQAQISVTDVEAVECWAEASPLKDAAEIKSLIATLRADEPEVPLGISACKTNIGNTQEVDGMFMILKVIHGQRYGVQVPSIHLSELNPHIDIWSGEEPILFNSEVIANAEMSSFVGMTGRSIGGTVAHCLTFGVRDTEERRPMRMRVEREWVTFWPAGGGELGDEAEPSTSKPYSIIGSWSDWEYSEPMASEGNGVYGYTVTLGEERFEAFQILLDGNTDQVLHPSAQFDGGWLSPQTSNVAGPDPSEACGELFWAIDGREELVKLVNPAEAEGNLAVQAADAEAPQVQNPYRKQAMPGATYRVRLSVAGKFRLVEWGLLEDGAKS